MVITRLIGGLGNQLFQYAVGRRLAHKLNTELKIDLRDMAEGSHHAYYRLGSFNIVESFAIATEIENMQVVEEKNSTVEEILNCADNVLLKGFWQNEKYFEDISEILLQELTLKNPLHANSAYWKKKILSVKNPVSLHVRHGDFVNPRARKNFDVIPVDYYKNSVAELKKFFSDAKIFVFSDDIDWAKNKLKFSIPTEFVEGCEEDFEELYLMSICKHNIIANSTFSWWGAYLNKNPDKKVFAPNPWYVRAPNMPFMNTKVIKIPINYKKNLELPPFYSVVMFIQNDSAGLDLTLPSLLNQKLKNYEIILVDSGGNNITEKSFPDFDDTNKITVLNVPANTSKITAWNKGIDIARGEYVLFLTNKDFLNNDAGDQLYEVWAFSYRKFQYETGKYLSFGNYEEFTPNVVCFTKYVELDSSGNSKLKADQSFQYLRIITEIFMEDSQKLIGLATQQINNSLATKFFKRKFLLENKIRFKDISGGGGVTTFSCRKFHEYR